MGPHIALQGNLAPTTLLKTKNDIKEEVGAILDSMGNDPGFIFNLGHGILPETNPEILTKVIKRVKNFK